MHALTILQLAIWDGWTTRRRACSVDRTVVLGAVWIHEDTFAVFLSLVPLAIIDGTVHKPIQTTSDTQSSFSNLLQYNHNSHITSWSMSERSVVLIHSRQNADSINMSSVPAARAIFNTRKHVESSDFSEDAIYSEHQQNTMIQSCMPGSGPGLSVWRP